ncbi:MAG: transglycosylase SLT domain-containing protein [Victivallaceae bacterium]|nr:transglycosylase SLT domain-containing protein [Victivallaceae bacterium]
MAGHKKTSLRKTLSLLLRSGGLMVIVISFFVVWRDFVSDYLIDDTVYLDTIEAAAVKHGLPPDLVRAVIRQESKFDVFAVGSAGEIGLMQILPNGAVADFYRVNGGTPPERDRLFDPERNLDIGCWYLARALRRWGGYRNAIELALCQYNAGEKRAMQWCPEEADGEVIPRITILSTRKYVTRIMQNFNEYQKNVI